MIWKIAAIGKNPTVTFAAEELQKYLQKIDPSCEYILMTFDAHRPAKQDVLWIGQSDAFSVPEVSDPFYDDGIAAEVQGRAGYISGTNPRSVLLAVYRFLRELGCAFVRPGKDGEIIPRRDLTGVAVSLFETPSYRHRGICCEGAMSASHILNLLDWMPKVGFNSYFYQHRNPIYFFNNWYQHSDSMALETEDFTSEDAEGVLNQTIGFLKKRGMIYHAVGHGFACDAFGLTRDMDITTIPSQTKACLAMVNGKREIHKAINFTQLCYSAHQVQEALANEVLDYCRNHPEVDCLHVWPADGRNNNCECENCQKKRPSDFYIDIMNRIDRKLTAAGIDTKIAFAVYMDMFWAPLETRIENPDRFFMMFAPYDRHYTTTLAALPPMAEDELPSFQRNHLKFPTQGPEYQAFLKEWKKNFTGDSFVFDYHFMWDHYRDPGYHEMARILFQDFQDLKILQLNGSISCQTQRAFLPTGFGMYAMAEALWNRDTDFNALADKYFQDAFGSDGSIVRAYMAELSRLFDPPYWRRQRKPVNQDNAAAFAQIPNVVENFLAQIRQHISEGANAGLTAGQLQSWNYLIPHGQLCILLANLLALLAQGNLEAAHTAEQAVLSYARQQEPVLHHLFDVFDFCYTLDCCVYKPIVNQLTKESTANN